MNDLISRQAAIDALEREQSLIERPITETRWFDLGLKKAQEVLSELPSVQPERPKGRWVHDGYDFPGGVDWIHCSECGKRGINVPADLSNFCPNCGADMREEDL